MTEDNVMEFCQWLVSEKGIEAGNLSDYINNNEEEVLKLAKEFKNPKFKVGGKVEAAAEMFKCGGKANKVEKKQEGGETPNHTIYDLKTGKVSKKVDGIGSKETYVDGPSRRTLEVFNGDSTIVTKNPNWPESRSRSYEDIMTFRRKKDIGFDTNLRSFNGIKEMFQKKYPNVKSMAGGGETELEDLNRKQYRKPLKVTRPVPSGGEAVMYPGLKDTLFEFMPDPGKRVIVNTKDSIGTGFDINGNINKIPADSTAKIKIMLDQVFNTPVKK